MLSSDTDTNAVTPNTATSYNSAYVHRRLRRRIGLRGAAARRSATWPFGLVGLRATSPTRGTLCKMPCGKDAIGESGFRRSWEARDLDLGWIFSDVLSRIALPRAITDCKWGVSAGRLELVLMARQSSLRPQE